MSLGLMDVRGTLPWGLKCWKDQNANKTPLLGTRERLDHSLILPFVHGSGAIGLKTVQSKTSRFSEAWTANSEPLSTLKVAMAMALQNGAVFSTAKGLSPPPSLNNPHPSGRATPVRAMTDMPAAKRPLNQALSRLRTQASVS